jgi:hypothetical protein
VTVPLRAVAHARAGDKGDVSNVAVFAYEPADYGLLRRTLTAARVRDEFAPLGADGVTRYELPTLGGLNFVVEGTLDGGVTSSLRAEPHGKSLSFLLLRIELDVDPDAVAASVGREANVNVDGDTNGAGDGTRDRDAEST